MEQAQIDAINAQMMAQYQKDRQLNNAVTVLQGIVAAIAVITFMYGWLKKV